MPPILYDSVHSGFPSTRINLSPFTKDFRGGEQLNESIDQFFLALPFGGAPNASKYKITQRIDSRVWRFYASSTASNIVLCIKLILCGYQLVSSSVWALLGTVVVEANLFNNIFIILK